MYDSIPAVLYKSYEQPKTTSCSVLRSTLYTDELVFHACNVDLHCKFFAGCNKYWPHCANNSTTGQWQGPYYYTIMSLYPEACRTKYEDVHKVAVLLRKWGTWPIGARSIGLIRIRKTHPSTTLIVIRWDEMSWDELRCVTVRLRSGWGSRQILLTYDLCIRLPVPAGAFSRGPRGCQAHPNQGVVKYHTLRLPDPNSSVNFSDEPDELGLLIRIWISPIERLIRKRRSPPNPEEPNRTRP